MTSQVQRPPVLHEGLIGLSTPPCSSGMVLTGSCGKADPNSLGKRSQPSSPSTSSLSGSSPTECLSPSRSEPGTVGLPACVPNAHHKSQPIRAMCDDVLVLQAPRKIYGRLPKHCPFLGTFHHAPSAGNRARASFFDQLLETEEQHEKEQRIKTNPFTGTFHNFPGRYSRLHGLQRFRHHAPFKHSLSELDVWESLGHKVNEGVQASSKPDMATDFMNGVFTFSSNHVRRSLYPFKSKSSLKTDHCLGLAGRYRYGGAVDTLKRFGSSLDDCCLTSRSSTLYQNILMEWNGFRKYHANNTARLPAPANSFMARRSRTVSSDRRPPMERVMSLSATLSNSYSSLMFDTNGPGPEVPVGQAPGGEGGRQPFVYSSRMNRARPLVVQQEKKVTDKYDVNKAEVLGEGSFASVTTGVERETGTPVAVKGIRKRYLFTAEDKACARREIEHMFRTNSHPNVIRLLETFESVEHLYLVMERASLGNLEQILQLRRKLTELEAMWIIKQLLDAIDYLHSNGVLHLDLKPSNILFSEVEGSVSLGGGNRRGGETKKLWMYTSPLGMVLKLCDFGLSRKVPDVRYFKHTGDINKVPFGRVCGTGGYIACEILQRQPFGKPADMWSVGALCYQILSGTLPFIPPTKCLTQRVRFQGKVWEQISDEAKDFISNLLIVDQTKRLTAKQALAHCWLQTVPEWGPMLLKSSSSGQAGPNQSQPVR